MKRVVSAILMLIFAIVGITVSADDMTLVEKVKISQPGEIRINDNSVVGGGSARFLDTGAVWLPLRTILENLGATVTWLPDSQDTLIIFQGNEYMLDITSDDYYFIQDEQSSQNYMQLSNDAYGSRYVIFNNRTYINETAFRRFLYKHGYFLEIDKEGMIVKIRSEFPYIDKEIFMSEASNYYDYEFAKMLDNRPPGFYTDEQKQQRLDSARDQYQAALKRPDIDDAAITVDGSPITVKDVELIKAKAFVDGKSAKWYLIGKVRNIVFAQEANRLGIVPTQEAVNEAMMYNFISNDVYITGIPYIEYTELTKQGVYDSCKIEVMLKNLPEGVSSAEYTDNLIENADIVILKSEVESILYGR